MAAIETGCPYYIYDPWKVNKVTFNVPSASDFVGYITDVTGLDDAGVRENAQVIVAGDGGYHGQFWQDRRPWTISGIIIPTTPVAARSAAQEKIQGILASTLKLDGYLVWTPSDGTSRYVPFRKQQPMRISKGQSNVERTFQVAGVVADYRILDWTGLQSVNAFGPCPFATATATNIGTADASPIFTVTGPCNQPQITNLITGKTFIVGYNIVAGDALVIDLSQTYPTVTEFSLGADESGLVNIGSDYSIAVSPGAQTFRLQETATATSTGATSLRVQWRHSWL